MPPAPELKGRFWLCPRCVVMGIGTLGLHQLCWFYQEWRRVRDSGEDVWPLPRSIFCREGL